MFHVYQLLHNIHCWEAGTPDLKASKALELLDRDARLDLGHNSGTVHCKILLRLVFWDSRSSHCVEDGCLNIAACLFAGYGMPLLQGIRVVQQDKAEHQR